MIFRKKRIINKNIKTVEEYINVQLNGNAYRQIYWRGDENDLVVK